MILNFEDELAVKNEELKRMKHKKKLVEETVTGFERYGAAHREAIRCGATEDLLSPKAMCFELWWLLSLSSAQLWSYCSGDSEHHGHERFA